MEERNRRAILDNLDNLVEGISSFENLFRELRKRNLFNGWMENEIQNTEEKKKVEFLFWYVTTRGPNAFDQLCEALQELNHDDLANDLRNYRYPSTVRPFVNGYGASGPSLEEEYPYESEWTVTLGKPGIEDYDYDVERVYRMRSSPRGLALIINIRKYINDIHSERKGSEKDVERLQSILPQLGYEVTVKENLTGNEIEEEMRKFSKMEEHNQCDSAMVIVMCHGTRVKGGDPMAAQIIGIDNQTIYCHNLVELLLARRCEALRGKPKIFFFQLCRGDCINYPVSAERRNTEEEQNTLNVMMSNGHTNGHSVDMLVGEADTSVQTDGVMVGQTSMVRSDSDVLIGHATSPGMFSWRDERTGSWYIQTLCRVFAKHAHDTDLHSMLQIVLQEGVKLGIVPVEANQGFNRLLYFQPGIFYSSQITQLGGS